MRQKCTESWNARLFGKAKTPMWRHSVSVQALAFVHVTKSKEENTSNQHPIKIQIRKILKGHY